MKPFADLNKDKNNSRSFNDYRGAPNPMLKGALLMQRMQGTVWIIA